MVICPWQQPRCFHSYLLTYLLYRALCDSRLCMWARARSLSLSARVRVACLRPCALCVRCGV